MVSFLVDVHGRSNRAWGWGKVPGRSSKGFSFAPGGILYTTILPWCVPISSRYNLIDTDI